MLSFFLRVIEVWCWSHFWFFHFFVIITFPPWDTFSWRQTDRFITSLTTDCPSIHPVADFLARKCSARQIKSPCRDSWEHWVFSQKTQRKHSAGDETAALLCDSHVSTVKFQSPTKVAAVESYGGTRAAPWCSPAWCCSSYGCKTVFPKGVRAVTTSIVLIGISVKEIVLLFRPVRRKDLIKDLIPCHFNLKLFCIFKT